MLKTSIYFFILFILGIYLQASVVNILLPSYMVPDLVLILVVFVSLSSEKHGALIGVFLLGLLSDFASGLYVGPFALGYVISCVFIRGISRHVYADRFFSVVLVVFLASILKQLASRILVFSFIGFNSVSEFPFSIWLGQAVISALIAPFVLKYVLSPKRKKSFGI